jgi:hypothetical protein
MNSHCVKPSCKDGNCVGCKNGEVWCNDPRCHPYCRECHLTQNSDTVGYFFLLIFVIGIIMIIILIAAYKYYQNQPYVNIPLK